MLKNQSISITDLSRGLGRMFEINGTSNEMVLGAQYDLTKSFIVAIANTHHLVTQGSLDHISNSNKFYKHSTGTNNIFSGK